MTSLNSIIWSNDFPSVSTALSRAAVSGARSEPQMYVPSPWRLLRMPCSESVRMASLTLFRETPNVSASARSGGSLSPTLSPPFSIASCIFSESL